MATKNFNCKNIKYRKWHCHCHLRKRVKRAKQEISTTEKGLLFYEWLIVEFCVVFYVAKISTKKLPFLTTFLFYV
jgi:hypothetical protein